MIKIVRFRKALYLSPLLLALCIVPVTSSAQTEILLNGDAESNEVTENTGIPDNWVEIEKNWTASDFVFTPHGGNNHFLPSEQSGGIGNQHRLEQEIDISSDATDIDNGNVDISFSGYIITNGSDQGKFTVEFLNGSDAVIETYDSGFKTVTSWTQYTDNRTAPNGTRTIRVRLITSASTSSFVDAGFDDLSVLQTTNSSNAPPTTADADVYTIIDTEFAFSDTDFPFSDTDGGNLTAIDITTLPGSGTLYLDGNGGINNDTNDGTESVSAGDDISLADLQAGNLRFTPPSSTTGYQAVSFTFAVSDGTDFSTSSSTMNISLDADEVEISGTNGEDEWHLISNPYDSNLSGLLSSIWTQGATNADESFGPVNVFSYDEGTQAYSGLSDLGISPSGSPGYLVLFYADNNPNSGGIQGNWPKTISTSGTPNNGTVNISAQNTDDDGSTTLTNDEGWNLVGNPFGTNISVDAVITALDAAFTAVNASVYIWDPTANSGNGDFVSRTSGDAISPFQAFFVRLETPGESGSFSLDNSARTSTAATFLKEPEPDFPKVILSVNGPDVTDQLKLHFKNDGNVELDRNDVYKLPSLSSEYLQFFSLVGDQSLAVNNLPSQLEDEISIPLHLNSTESGVFDLQPTFESIPAQWSVELENIKTGEHVNLRETTGYRFEYSSTAQMKEQEDNPGLRMVKSQQSHLFNLIISPSGTRLTDNELPGSFTLKQNYPNPFNPSTRIEYNLPEQSRVSIKIYDMTGREIDTLINEQMPAGSHQITWNAANRSSGIYIYRLETSGVTFTKKMTLIK